MLYRTIAHWAVNALGAALLVLATIVLIYALRARRQADLQPWHTQAPQLEMTAADIGPRQPLLAVQCKLPVEISHRLEPQF